jgi:para-aminobenzoate synthetase component 1
MLEIHEPRDAFERIEAYLRAAGFFVEGGAHAMSQRADVYLGYGLSAASLRSRGEPPPEPAALPLAACRISDVGKPSAAPGPYRIGTWQQTWSTTAYRQAVQRVRASIAAGEVYQVNLVQHLSAPFEGDPAGVSAALATHGPLVPAPLLGQGWSIMSASPELFLGREGRRLWTQPIKGTRPSGEAAALRASAKDAAEHVMIVDLERNDLGRVCEPGSVHVTELMQARTMAGVEHLVSSVEGRLRADASWARIMAAMFPGGSVTGAPKIAALDHISDIEPVGRGAAMGALGTVWPNGDFEMALTIRTFAVTAGRIHFWVGGGIVWDSEADAEVEESWVKARPLLASLGAETRTSISA